MKILNGNTNTKMLMKTKINIRLKNVKEMDLLMQNISNQAILDLMEIHLSKPYHGQEI